MNPYRSELEAEIAGKTRCLRLTFDGLAAIEAALGSGIIDVAARFPARRVGTQEIFAILREALRGGGETVEDAQLSEAIMNMGVLAATRLAARTLATGLGAVGGEDPDPLATAPPGKTAGHGHFPGDR